MADPTARRALLTRFRAMYEAKHVEPDLFDLDGGFLRTLSDDDRMPLRFFVEHNNAWWFAIVDGVDVPAIAYDPDSDSGSIVLDIRYGDDTLRAMQHVHFGDDLIDRLRTYASTVFFTRPNPMVQLDAHGNAMWLETGYGLDASRRAAEVFLTTPKGKRFAADPVTKDAVVRIRANLDELRARS